jgi:hypothetical protein
MVGRIPPPISIIPGKPPPPREGSAVSGGTERFCPGQVKNKLVVVGANRGKNDRFATTVRFLPGIGYRFL